MEATTISTKPTAHIPSIQLPSSSTSFTSASSFLSSSAMASMQARPGAPPEAPSRSREVSGCLLAT
eukprot:CAMPEP_0177344724 /NCGR_PEP_ID=MMETSP0368-20130122/28263_1 /TAXON_ID=447022 ORGANISM="Scrippsiella hangoei-like, Strain SHHI-4" /NCGR_SAMPLE_ID=MMETSP0368 /ASSEMBLY_ACC=CAM_ASM_000363 /LENGTH=65 /DNA_ID=CAMNT_0018806245 /DNA_START=133 /DNA_END=326 /DNA_ORIENTATION=+